jgi:hypothetical protein
MSVPTPGSHRRCLWPRCRNPATTLVFCYQHFPALGEELGRRLRAAHGTDDWVPALKACQEHAKATDEWVKQHVTGGSHADSDKTGG